MIDVLQIYNYQYVLKHWITRTICITQKHLLICTRTIWVVHSIGWKDAWNLANVDENWHKVRCNNISNLCITYILIRMQYDIKERTGRGNRQQLCSYFAAFFPCAQTGVHNLKNYNCLCTWYKTVDYFIFSLLVWGLRWG